MKNILLLILWLMAGSETSSKLTGCIGGLVEFSCSYPNTSITQYKSIDLVIAREKATLHSTEYDRWENKQRKRLYHDTENKNIRVSIKPFGPEDVGEYEFKFYPGPGANFDSNTVKLDHDNTTCQILFNKTTKRTQKASLTCRSEGIKSSIEFFCKDNGFTCEDILSTKPETKSTKRFSLTEDSGSFSLFTRDETSEDSGVYWCGVESKDGKINLEVKDSLHPTTSTSVTVLASSVPATLDEPGQSDTVVITAVVCAALLMFVLLLVVVYNKLKNITNGKAQICREDHIYTEIRESSETTDSLTVRNPIYVTANLPRIPSVASDSTATVSENIYCTVGEPVQHSAYSTVGHPSTNTEELLYSTVNLPLNTD